MRETKAETPSQLRAEIEELLADKMEMNTEIISLRAENERLKHTSELALKELQVEMNRCDTIRAENERLREALEKIGRVSNTDPFRTFDDMIQDMQMIDDIARAALSQSQGDDDEVP